MTENKTIFISIDFTEFNGEELTQLTVDLNRTFSKNYKVVVLDKKVEFKSVDEVKTMFNNILRKIDDKDTNSDTSNNNT